MTPLHSAQYPSCARVIADPRKTREITSGAFSNMHTSATIIIKIIIQSMSDSGRLAHKSLSALATDRVGALTFRANSGARVFGISSWLGCGLGEIAGLAVGLSVRYSCGRARARLASIRAPIAGEPRLPGVIAIRRAISSSVVNPP